MKLKSLVVVLLLLAAFMLMSCSLSTNENVIIGGKTDGVTSAEFVLSNLRSDGFEKDGISLSDSNTNNVVLSANDEVWVTVRLGKGIYESYMGNASSSIADFLLSAEGEAAVSRLTAQQTEIIEMLAQANISAEIKYNYTVLQNGFSAKIKYGDLAAIKALPGVEGVVLSQQYAIPQVDMEAIAESFASTGIFNNDTDFSGRGTVVAIIDTGVDVEHQAFAKEPYGASLKMSDIESLLSLTKAFERDSSLTAEDIYFSGKVPFGFNYADSNTEYNPDLSDAAFNGHEHGTHVAGIATGNDDTIQGAAYNAQLAVMRVFGSGSGGAYDVDIYAALEDCIILGVDVANLSLGSACGFVEPNGEDAEYVSGILTLAQRTGLTICCATGNDGTAWWFSDTYQPFSTTDDPDTGTISAPASYDGTFAVGSIDNFVQIFFEFAGQRIIGRNTRSGEETVVDNDFFKILGDQYEGEFEYVMIPGVGAASDYDGIDVNGKIAVVKRGDLSFTEKVTNAADKGAIACILYDNEDEPIGYFGALVNELRIPSMAITMADGKVLSKAAEKKITVAKDNYYVNYSVFSSMGTLDDLTIGVDIVGVGGEVYSSVNMWYSLFNGTDDYVYMSGTSMATPNISGVMAALKGYLKERYPDKTGAQIATMAQQRLMSTADQLENQEGNPITPRRQGAGLADLRKAINTQAYLTVTGSDKAKLSLGHDPNKDGIYTLNYNLVNDGDQALTYAIATSVFTESAVDANANNYTMKGMGVNLIDEMAYMFDDASIKYIVNGKTLEGNEITVEAGSTVRIKVVIRLSDEDKAYMDETFANGIYVEGYSVLESLNADGIDLSIPYTAFYGDWNKLPAFEPLPWEGAPTWYNNLGISLVQWAFDGVFFDGTLFNAGAYQFMAPEGYKKPETSADKSVIGSGVDENGVLNSTSSLDSFAIAIKRNASAIYLDIVKADTGELISRDVFNNVPKGCVATNGGYGLNFNSFIPADMMLANNEKLILKFTYDFNGVPVGQVAEMPLYIDLEAPTLNKAEWRVEDGRLYLDLNVFDNHYLQATGLLTYGTEDSFASLYKFMFPAYGERNSDYAYTIDVTDHLPNIVNDTFGIKLVDYAGNTVNYEIELPEEYKVGHIAPSSVENNQRQLTVLYSANGTTVYTDVNDPTYIEVRSNYSSTMLGDANNVVINEIESDEEFVIEDGVLVAYNGKGGEVIVPDGVKEINYNVFEYIPEITKIVLPEGLTKIQDFAIYRLANLTELVLPSTLEYIGKNAVSCLPKLTELNLEDTNINNVAGGLMGLTAITELTFPKADKPLVMNFSVGLCSKLTKIVFNGDVEYFASAILFNDELKEVEFFGKVADLDGTEGSNRGFGMGFTSCDKLERIVFHEEVGEIGNTTLQDWGDWVTKEHTQAFATLPALKEVIFEKDVETISGYSFAGCYKLEKVYFGGNITNLGTSAFGDSNMLVGGFDISDDNEYLIKDVSGIVYNKDKTIMYMPPAWDYNGILELPESITALHERQFSVPDMVPMASKQDYGINDETLTYYWSLGSSFMTPNTTKSLLKGIKLGSQITELPEYCFFANTSLETINLENITKYGGHSLAQTAIKELVFGENVTYIGSGVFSGCAKLEKLVLNENAEYAGFSSFYSGTGLREIVVPEFMKSAGIGSYMFSNCTNLERVEFLYDATRIGSSAFHSCSSLREIVGIDNVTAIDGAAFYNCSSLSSICLPKVTTIGFSAFEGCTNLASAEFENLEIIRDDGWGTSSNFRGCTSLEVFTIPEKLREFDVASAFEDCTALQAINVHENNPYYSSVDGVLFNNDMTNIVLYPSASENEEFEVPDTITMIGDNVFKNAINLKKVIMLSVESIGYSAFVGTSLKEAVVSEKLILIYANAFAGTPLETIDLSNVLEIDDGVFANTKLSEITFNKLSYIGNKVFEGAPIKTITLGDVEEFNFSRTFYGVSGANVILDGCEVFVKENNMLLSANKAVLYRYFGKEANVVIPEGIVKIDAEAFRNNGAIQTVVLPATLGYIGDGAFLGCNSLTEIEFKSEKAPVLQSYLRYNVRYLYNQFVNEIEKANGNEAVTIRHGADASYDTAIWRLYFKNHIVK